MSVFVHFLGGIFFVQILQGVNTGPTMFCWRFGSPNENVPGSISFAHAHEIQTPGQDGNQEVKEAVDGPAKVGGRLMLGLSLLAWL